MVHVKPSLVDLACEAAGLGRRAVRDRRTFEALWAALGDICALFSPDECWNFFKEAGYAST